MTYTGEVTPGGTPDVRELQHLIITKVAVDDQVVTLTGEVGDYLEDRYAWDDAWDTTGVRGVINNLTVRLDDATGKHEEPFPQSEVEENATTTSGGTKRRSRK